MIGDVLLVKGQRKHSELLVKAQKAIYSGSVSSHAELSLGDGTFIHATNDGGVHLTFFLDELKECSEGWRVIRLKGISESEQDKILTSALYFLRQGYNKIYMGNGTDDASFCSELVAKIYQKSEIHILDDKVPSKVAPAHFDKEADLSIKWEDVTQEYIDLVDVIKTNEVLYRIAFKAINDHINKRHETSNMRDVVFRSLQILAEDSNEQGMINTVESWKKNLRENRGLSFWDENDAKPIEGKVNRKF